MIIHAMERSPMGQPPPHLLKLFSYTILWKYFHIFRFCCLFCSVQTPFGGTDNHLIAFISARPLALTDQQESDTTGRAGVKQHHTHHLCDLQMNSTAPNIMLLTFSVVMSKLTYEIHPCLKILISKIQPL